jgi:hypothetical protein
LESQALSLNVGGFGLYDGDIPLRRLGLGSRRLLAVAMQREATIGHGVALIDELENGLEPHRQRRAVRLLRQPAGEGTDGQLVMTTHSPAVLAELDCQEIRIVRSQGGITQIMKVDKSLHPVVLKSSEAFFSRRVIVCEGKTELGLCLRLDEWWSESGPSFALSGVALADGGGTDSASRAAAFAAMGYDVALLVDSDCDLEPGPEALEAAGAVVLRWNGACATEERLTLDLPWEGVVEMVALAQAERGAESVRGAVATRLDIPAHALPMNPHDWRTLEAGELRVRAAVGSAAKKHKGNGREGWFKRVDLAHELGGIIVNHLPAIPLSDLYAKFTALKAWAHRDG